MDTSVDSVHVFATMLFAKVKQSALRPHSQACLTYTDVQVVFRKFSIFGTTRLPAGIATRLARTTEHWFSYILWHVQLTSKQTQSMLFGHWNFWYVILCHSTANLHLYEVLVVLINWKTFNLTITLINCRLFSLCLQVSKFVYCYY